MQIFVVYLSIIPSTNASLCFYFPISLLEKCDFAHQDSNLEWKQKSSLKPWGLSLPCNSLVHDFTRQNELIKIQPGKALSNAHIYTAF